MKISKSGCCSCNGGCCSPKREEKKIVIDFLFLDLSICERCKGTEKNLIDAITDVSQILNVAGYEVIINKINITSKEQAIEYKFKSSPTIRINGRDIDANIKETECECCGDLCGESVDCRVWEYEGEEYTEPPIALIVNAILNEVYNENKVIEKDNEYTLPHNLEVFFEGKSKKES